MNRIEGQRGANQTSPSTTEAIRLRIEKELAGGAMLLQSKLLTVATQHGASPTTYRYFQTAAGIAKKDGELRGLAELARRVGLDLKKCGPELAAYAPKGPRDLLQRAPMPAFADQSPGKRLDQVLQKTGHGQLERAFYHDRAYGFTTLQALGRLPAAEVRTRAGTQTDRLRAAAFSSFRGLVAGRVQDAVGKALGQVKLLLGDAKARQAFLSSFPSTPARGRALRALGVEADAARKLAAAPAANDRVLLAALDQATRALDTVHRWVERGVRLEEIAVGVLAGFKPVVDELRRELGVKAGSFLDEAVAAGLKRGQAILKRDAAVKLACGLACSLIVGGLASPIVVGSKGAALAAKIAQKAAKAVVFEGQALAGAHHAAARLETAEGLGLADQATTARARSDRNKQWVKSIAGLGLEAAGMALSDQLGKALEPVTRLLDQEKAALSKGISIAAGMGGKQGLKAELDRTARP